MLIAISINAFSMDKYVVCEERKMPKLTACVNDYLDKGYKPLSGLHAVGIGSATTYFQALIK
tara:strand:+ start:763 stop:948 length:186 start_codon:yes stop_codon:yes gene_type:complete